MRPPLAIALYFVIWWTTLFAVLPFNGRTQDESGTVVPGTPGSAPAHFRMLRLVVLNTVVATAVFGLVLLAIRYDVFGIVAGLPPPQR